MNPFKLIHKYKSNEGKVAYTMYNFIGWNTPKNVMVLLEKIKDLNWVDISHPVSFPPMDEKLGTWQWTQIKKYEVIE